MSEQPREPSERGRPGERPAWILLDVNETLSDMAPMADRFEDVGAPGHLATTWFAGVLRDGFALAAAGTAEPFAQIGSQSLHALLEDVDLTRGVDEAVDHVMAGFGQLEVHADVPGGLRALRGLGIRLATLSNGAASVAEGLLDRAGVLGEVDAVLSVEDAGVWKPARGAYDYALGRCGVRPADAMLVAVHPWDTDGAQRAGLSTAWISRTGGRYPGHFASPDVRARSLVELAELLG